MNKQLFVQYLQYIPLPWALFMEHYTSSALKIYLLHSGLKEFKIFQ